MYPIHELALQRQAEIRATVAHDRMVRDMRSGAQPTRALTLPAWTRRFRLTTTHFRAAQA